MLELTLDECTALEKRVTEKICADIPESDVPEDNLLRPFYSIMVQTAVYATIATIREYERMKQSE